MHETYRFLTHRSFQHLTDEDVDRALDDTLLLVGLTRDQAHAIDRAWESVLTATGEDPNASHSPEFWRQYDDAAERATGMADAGERYALFDLWGTDILERADRQPFEDPTGALIQAATEGARYADADAQELYAAPTPQAYHAMAISLHDQAQHATLACERALDGDAAGVRRRLPEIARQLLANPWHQGPTRRQVEQRVDLTLLMDGLPDLDALRAAADASPSADAADIMNMRLDRHSIEHALERTQDRRVEERPRQIIDPQIDPKDVRLSIDTWDGVTLMSDTDVHLAAMLADHELGEGWEQHTGAIAEHWDFSEYLDVVGDHAKAVPAPPAQDEPATHEQSPAITIYTTPSCPGCQMTKQKLTEAGVPFETIDLSTRPDLVEAFTAEGLLSAPIIQTPDGKRTAGFRPDRIKAIIAAGTSQPTTTATPAPPARMSRVKYLAGFL